MRSRSATQRVAQPVALAPPSRSPRAQVRHGQQDGQRVAAGRRHPRLRARRRVHVGREGPRQLGPARDGADELAVAVAHQQRVVQQRLERAGPCRGRAGSRTSSPAAGAAAAGGRRARACAGRRRWRRRRRPAIRSPPARRTPVTRPPACSIASTRLAAADVERPRHRLHHAVDAAVGVPAAVEHLQVDQRAVDRGHAVRVAADEQRVEGERLAHARVLEVAGHEGVQRAHARRAAPSSARSAGEVARARGTARRPAARMPSS